MTRLCIGTVFKILSLSKRGGVSDKALGEVIFGGPYGENLNDAAINRIKNCVGDIYDYDEISPYFCYKGNEDGFYITLNCLSENDLLTISEEYFKNIYGNKDINDSQEAIKYLYEIDPMFRRPLYLMMICEAIIAGTIDKIHNEEELLDYVYRVELKRLRDKIKAVFGFSHTENTIIYDTVERDYADAIIWSYFGKSKEISNYIFKYVDLPEGIVKQKCEDYGLCQDGIVPIIEPDLLGEYFVL